MASQEVLKSLEVLHKELDKLRPAIKHVEALDQVVGMVKSIPEKQIEFLNNISQTSISLRSELLQMHSDEITRISGEVIKITEQTRLIQDSVIAEAHENEALRSKLTSLYDYIARIDFPDRLDKIDAQITEMLSATKTLQGSIGQLEIQINQSLSSLKQSVSEEINASKTEILNLKTLFYITWILLVIIIIVVVALK